MKTFLFVILVAQSYEEYNSKEYNYSFELYS